MKNLLTKTLFISLLLSAAIPSGAQANLLNRAGTFLKKHPIAVGATAAGTTFAWKLPKIIKQRKLNNDLWKATKEGDIIKAKQALESGAGANNKSWHNFSVLIEAATLGHQEIAKLLIINGASVNHKCVEPWYLSKKYHRLTALMEASEKGYFEIVKLLIHNGANINEKDLSHQKTALSNSIIELSFLPESTIKEYNSASKMIKVIDELLTSNEIEIDNQDIFGTTALMYATSLNLPETACKLLDHKNQTKINSKDIWGTTALMYTAMTDQLETARKLLNHKNQIEIDSQDSHGKTALMHAAGRGHLNIVELLLANKANANKSDKWGHTALRNAVQSGHLNIVKLLLANGADPTIQDKNGHTASMWARKWGHLEVAKLLEKLDKK